MLGRRRLSLSFRTALSACRHSRLRDFRGGFLCRFLGVHHRGKCRVGLCRRCAVILRWRISGLVRRRVVAWHGFPQLRRVRALGVHRMPDDWMIVSGVDQACRGAGICQWRNRSGWSWVAAQCRRLGELALVIIRVDECKRQMRAKEHERRHRPQCRFQFWKRALPL